MLHQIAHKLLTKDCAISVALARKSDFLDEMANL